MKLRLKQIKNYFVLAAQKSGSAQRVTLCFEMFTRFRSSVCVLALNRVLSSALLNIMFINVYKTKTRNANYATNTVYTL